MSAVVAYVDGSYDVSTGKYSFGAVIFHDGQELHFAQAYDHLELAAMRNVAGEIQGAICAMSYCLEHGVKSLDLYYDYEGVEKWCTGEWKAKKDGTKSYRDFYLKASQSLKVNFKKVKGHSGDKYNDLADALAKSALEKGTVG